MSAFPPELEAAVRRRLAKAEPEIQRSLGHIASGNPLASEPDAGRLVSRLKAKAQLSQNEAEIVAFGIQAQGRAEGAEGVSAFEKVLGAEAIRGATLDFVGVAFLERGRRAADAVARVIFRNGRPLGSGFLIAPGLLLTNNHVLRTTRTEELCAEFDYELDGGNARRPVTRFAFDPAALFVFDAIDALDYTLIALGPTIGGTRELESLGEIPLSDASDKHALGEVANIVQHPQGRYKELVLRENRLVSRLETEHVLHYIADTEQGSSGSPVFNNEWQAIALHHWGGPHLERSARDGRPLDREINEGVRISAIVKDLRAKMGRLPAAQRRRLEAAFARWESTSRDDRESRPAAAQAPSAGPRTNADGSVSWIFPVEISVRAPLLQPAPPAEPPVRIAAPAVVTSLTGSEARRRRSEEDFSDRGGYEPGFLPGVNIPLPGLDNVPHRAAVNQLRGPRDDEHELRYHHFSIVMNADRRLAFFTACNIDGARSKAINRKTKTVTDDPTLHDLDVESLSPAPEGMEGAEASDAFEPDPRVLDEEQMSRPFYERQNVPGFLEPRDKERIARMFQKGHIIMRGDPAWGQRDEALAAEADTFFYTNAAPQVGFFNQGSRLDRPGSKGKLRWRAVETYVLRNAVAERQRVTVMAGPLFNDDTDPEYRFSAQIPLQFWKIALWANGGELRSVALLADQSPVLTVMPEALAGAEQFDDADELARVPEFLSTVEEIEALTGLGFGEVVKRADIRGSAERLAVGEAGNPLEPRRTRSRPLPLKTPATKKGGTGGKG